MNILFLTMAKLTNLNDTMAYTDLLYAIADKGHKVYAVCPLEKRDKRHNYIEEKKNIILLHTNIRGNYFDVSPIEKGLTLLSLENGYIKGIKEYFQSVKFDQVLYTTPPISFNKVVEFVKKRDGAMSYLMLKDIFPQNAVDIGMMSTTGIKGLIYRFFRRKEKKLYCISDRIGCMSQANVDYVIKHNPEINPEIVEICPNCINVIDKSVDFITRRQIREKYNIPINRQVFIYGGNLGKPQGIPFLIECLKKCKDMNNVFFLIVGGGTEYRLLEDYVNISGQNNLGLMKRLPKEDYDTVVGACDVGMIFLDYRFTIPNFPSRLLSYMQARLPVLACTDPNTDIGKVIIDGEFGWWCESDDSNKFIECIQTALKADLTKQGMNAYRYLVEHYDVNKCIELVL